MPKDVKDLNYSDSDNEYGSNNKDLVKYSKKTYFYMIKNAEQFFI